jgi:hypothetical protein
VQAQQSSRASRIPELPGSLALGLTLIRGVVFSLPVILLQVCLLYLFKIDYPLTLHYGWRDGLILLLFAVSELSCSFLAALFVARRTRRVWASFSAGLLARILSGLTGFLFTLSAWHQMLVRLNRPLLVREEARLVIGRSVVELLISLLLCACCAALGTLAGHRLSLPRPFLAAYGPESQSAPKRGRWTAEAFPATPTPGGWRFRSFDYSQRSQSSLDRQAREWQYGEVTPDLRRQSYPGLPGDDQTRAGSPDDPAGLIPSDTALPLPYPWAGDRQAPRP